MVRSSATCTTGCRPGGGLEHPYFAVPSRVALFELKQLPPGTYTIVALMRTRAPDHRVTLAEGNGCLSLRSGAIVPPAAPAV